jgi:MATE family multidrug resistance protein
MAHLGGPARQCGYGRGRRGHGRPRLGPGPGGRGARLVGIWVIVVVTLMGIMMSVNPTVAHYVGAGSVWPGAPRRAPRPCGKALGVGLVAMVLANLWRHWCLTTWRLEPVVRDIATRYVHRSPAWPCPPLPATACCTATAPAWTRPSPSWPFRHTSPCCFNCGLNWVLIYGNLGVPEAGRCGLCLGHHAVYCGSTCSGLDVVDASAAQAYRSTWPFDRFRVAPTAKRCAACSSWACP